MSNWKLKNVPYAIFGMAILIVVLSAGGWLFSWLLSWELSTTSGEPMSDAAAFLARVYIGLIFIGACKGIGQVMGFFSWAMSWEPEEEAQR